MCFLPNSNPSRPRLARTEPAPRFHRDRSRKNAEVSARTPPSDVFQIRMKPLLDAGVAAPSTNLRQTRQPRPHLQPPRVVGKPATENLGVSGHLRARTDQRHFALEHVPQLRQLIEVETAQSASKPCPRRKFLIAPVVRAGFEVRGRRTDLVKREAAPIAAR